MIAIRDERPQNSAHFSRLLAFYQDIIPVCHNLHITPLLTGSLAVFAYTRNPMMRVNDIDLACSETAFPQLGSALAAHGMAAEVKAWHVLQVRKDELKVEFDSLEYWCVGVPTDYDTLIIDKYLFNVVSLSSLRELYRRGLEEVARQHDAVNRAKYAAVAEKYAFLCTVTTRRSLVEYYIGPCAGVPITVRDAATGAVVGEAVTDARGVASLAFPPGHYTVAVPVPPPDTACGRSTLGVFPQSRVVVVPPARVTEVAVDWLLYVDPPRPTRQP